MERAPELRAIASEQGPYRRLWDVSRALEGIVRHVSTHAAGILISNEPLLEKIPLCKGAGDEVLTQYDMNALKDVGLLKLDILGLRTLTVIDDTLELIAGRRKEKVDLGHIPLEDDATFKLLREAKTAGVFQLESRGMSDYIRKLEPRVHGGHHRPQRPLPPGPPGERHGGRLHPPQEGAGEGGVPSPHAGAHPENHLRGHALPGTGHAHRQGPGGLHPGPGRYFRRAMGSKNPEKMEQMRGKFLSGAKERGISRPTRRRPSTTRWPSSRATGSTSPTAPLTPWWLTRPPT